MRGKGKAALEDAQAERITPAYAGKSAGWHQRPAGRWDHPRVCGEKTYSTEVGDVVPGSPPRMRGKVDQDSADVGADGITPAYAGKSRSGSSKT